MSAMWLLGVYAGGGVVVFLLLLIFQSENCDHDTILLSAVLVSAFWPITACAAVIGLCAILLIGLRQWIRQKLKLTN